MWPLHVNYEKPRKMRLESRQEPSMPSESVWSLFGPYDFSTESGKQETHEIPDRLFKDKPCCSVGKSQREQRLEVNSPGGNLGHLIPVGGHDHLT